MDSFKIAELKIKPSPAKLGKKVTMECLCEIEGGNLECVSWYKGVNEFYRYCPNRTSKHLFFPTQLDVIVRIFNVFYTYICMSYLTIS